MRLRLLNWIFRVVFDFPRRAAIAAAEYLLGRAGREAIQARECGHESLAFAMGGFHLFCRGCSRTWVAFKAERGEPDYEAMADGVDGDRVAVPVNDRRSP